MTYPDSHPGTTPPSDANLGTPSPDPLTRRAFRNREAGRLAAQTAEAEATRLAAEAAEAAHLTAHAAEAEAARLAAEAAEVARRTAQAAESETTRPADEAREAEPARLAAADPAAADPAAVAASEVPTAAAAELVFTAEPIALTRRERRELDQRERAEADLRQHQAAADTLARETRLQAEELADLEIAPLGSGALEPDLTLVLEPSLSPADAALGADVPLHLPAASTMAVPTASAIAAPTASTTRRSIRADERTATPASPRIALPARATRTTLATRSAPRALLATRIPKSRITAAVTAPAAAATKPATTPTRRRRPSWAKTGFSAIAMAFVVAMTAVTALPTTVSASPVDANVVNLSLNASTAETQQLITASSASEVVDRDGYGVSDAGELQAAGYSTAQLLVGRSLAQELVNAMDAGKLVGSQPDHMKEIRWIAQGVTVPDCGVDYRILEIIAVAVRNFDQVGVSDINRKCTGQIEGAGTSSSHYIDGGGHAVDFYLLDNKSLNGADAGTLKMISLLDPIMPVGARVGQASCRTSAGVKLSLTNWTEFDDSCTHMHVDVPVSDAPLLLADNDALLAQ